MQGTLSLYNWWVTIPTHPNGHLRIAASAFGVNEEDSMREIAERFPLAIEINPKEWKHGPGAGPLVICKTASPEDGADWCMLCGQSNMHHPILAGTPLGDQAEEWINLLRQDATRHPFD